MAEDDNRRKRGNTLRIASGEFAAVVQTVSPLPKQDSTTGPNSFPDLAGEETKPGVAPPKPPITDIHEKWDSDGELDRPTQAYGDKPKEEATLGIFPTRTFEVDQVLAEPGDELPCLIIVEGAVDMSLVLADGKLRSVRLLYPGDIVGGGKLSDLHGVSLKSEWRLQTVAAGYAYIVPTEASVTFSTQQRNYLLTTLARNTQYSDQTIIDLTKDKIELTSGDDRNEVIKRVAKKHFEEKQLLAEHLLEQRDREKAQQEFIASLEEEYYFYLIGSGQPFLIDKGLNGMRNAFLSLGT